MINKFIPLLFAIFFTFWTVRIYYKLYDNKTRIYILIIGLLIIFWMLVRIIKGVTINIKLERICWYLYYLPLIFIPTLFYICSNSLLNKMNKKQKILIYIVSLTLFILVLSNDYHQFVFKFNKGKYYHNDYNHYIGYYIIFIWIFYLFGGGMTKLVINRLKIKKDLKAFLPLLVLLIGLIYTCLYVSNIPFFREMNMSIINSILICLGIELAFYLDLIPNNRKYIQKFSNSNLDMAIVSLDGKIKYTTSVFKILPNFILDDIKNNKVQKNYKKKYIVYDVKKNKDSYVILKKDLTNVFELKNEIAKQKKELLHQQESMKLEEKTKRELYEIKIRKDTINNIEKRLNEKRQEAKDILMKDNISKNDLEKVKRIIMYSKKKSMIMISEMNNEVYNEESIKIILNELIIGMKSLNVEGLVVVKNEMIINGRIMSYLYDIVYELIDNSKNNSIVIYVFKDKNIIKLKAIIDINKSIKNKLKLDFNIIKVKESIYDTDTELEFIIKDSDKI
ncbi:MAG: histidine kinase N-terminal 7TM domain-containing protein [Bacilli bacterium]